MVGWHHQLNGHDFEQTLRDSEGQGSPGCCSPWGWEELDTTERLNSKWGGAGEVPTSASLSSSQSPSQTNCGWASHC